MPAHEANNLQAFPRKLTQLINLATVGKDDTVITNARHLEALTKVAESRD